MSEGLPTTFDLLTATPNEAATRFLSTALESPGAEIRERALAALLARGSVAAHREVLRCLRLGGEAWRPIIEQYAGRMSAALREAIEMGDAQLFENACTVAIWRREFELIGALAAKLTEEGSPHQALAARALEALTAAFAAELASPRAASDCRAPVVRQQVIAALEPPLRRYAAGGRREILDAFLMLAHREDAALRRILMEPHHEAYQPLIDELAHSERASIVTLLLSYLDDHQPPLAVLDVIARRADREFLDRLFAKLGEEPTIAVRSNLKRIESFSWIGSDGERLAELSGAEQVQALRLVLLSGVPRTTVYRAVERTLESGQVEGRRAAIAALAEFSGPDADALAVRSLRDRDPEVQADAARQVRSRGMPGAIQHLIDLLEDPHPAVREAARQNLGEFTFLRFMAAYDTLEPRARRSTGLLVRKVDPDTPRLLARELHSPVRTSRLRAIDVAIAIEMVGVLEAGIIDLLDDEDYVVRVEAANALAHCATPTVRAALAHALDDASALVQEAAGRSLRQMLDVDVLDPARPAPQELPVEEHVHD